MGLVCVPMMRNCDVAGCVQRSEKDEEEDATEDEEEETAEETADEEE